MLPLCWRGRNTQTRAEDGAYLVLGRVAVLGVLAGYLPLRVVGRLGGGAVTQHAESFTGGEVVCKAADLDISKRLIRLTSQIFWQQLERQRYRLLKYTPQ